MPTRRRLGGRSSIAGAVDQHAPGGLPDEAGDGPQQRGLAAAGGAEQRQHLPRPHRKVHVVERGEGAVAHAEAQHVERVAAQRGGIGRGRWGGSELHARLRIGRCATQPPCHGRRAGRRGAPRRWRWLVIFAAGCPRARHPGRVVPPCRAACHGPKRCRATRRPCRAATSGPTAPSTWSSGGRRGEPCCATCTSSRRCASCSRRPSRASRRPPRC